MAIAFMNVFDANVVNNIREFIPLNNITICVLHQTDERQLDSDEYEFVVPVGTTVGKIKEKLLATEFREYGWLASDMILDTLNDDDDELPFDDMTIITFLDEDKLDKDMILHLTLQGCEDGQIYKHYDEEDSEEEDSEEEDSEAEERE